MFSTCRSTQTPSSRMLLTTGLASVLLQRTAGALLLIASIAACSKEPALPPHEPLVMPPANQQAPASAPRDEQTIVSEIVANGIAASYRATFAAEQLQRIAETRSGSRIGEYEFRGARLLRYAGAGLSNAGAIEVRLDLDGAVTMSHAGSGEVPAAEISALRTRAQLLRSHALAQRASSSHQPH